MYFCCTSSGVIKHRSSISREWQKISDVIFTKRAHKNAVNFVFMIKYFCLGKQINGRKAKVEKTHHRLRNDSDNIKINIIHMAMKGEGKENKFKVETIFAYNFLPWCGNRQRCDLWGIQEGWTWTVITHSFFFRFLKAFRWWMYEKEIEILSSTPYSKLENKK